MGSISRLLFRLTKASPERKACRSLLIAAKRGDSEQYLALASHYVPLVQAYFGNCLHEDREVRMDRTSRIFTSLWEQVSYAERLSDFEYMLARTLIDSTPDGPIGSNEPLVTRIRMLNPEVRFAFLAIELDQWPVRWVTLVLRIRSQRLHRLLAEARCELCGISWESLANDERECLEAVSAGMEECLNVKHNKALAQRVSAFPRVAQIKAHWLELRPEIVEVRHRYLPTTEQKEEIFRQILTGITEASMRKPALVDRLVNTVHFSRHSRIQVS